MGFLHEGHLSLVQSSVQKCDVTIMSIFVNPLQFGPNEDFDRYPRDIERDTLLAKEAGVNVLFCPDVHDLYPKELSVKMIANKRTDVLCGSSRPGHFDGVVSVLTILFHLVQPHKAFFGQKDAQQVAVVQGLVDSYFFPIEIVTVPTIREEDGLAKSSRNVYLTDQEREEAPKLYQALLAAKEQFDLENLDNILEEITELVKRQTSGTLDYVQALTYPELKQVTNQKDSIIIAIAVQFKHVRLIDNVLFKLKEETRCIEQ